MTAAGGVAPRSEEELDDVLSTPRDATVEALRRAPGDIIVLGAGGLALGTGVALRRLGRESRREQ